jgi:hypothetical protein
MNLVGAIQAFLPKAVHPRSDLDAIVDAIVAGVPKAPELIGAEREFVENEAARQVVAKRLAEIFERLNFKSPVRRTLFATEQSALEAERFGLDRKVAELAARAHHLQSQIAGLTPAYARAVASALAGFRSRAANQLLDSVCATEQAIENIRRSNKVLASVGLTPPPAFALPYASALRGLATKVRNERFS